MNDKYINRAILYGIALPMLAFGLGLYLSARNIEAEVNPLEEKCKALCYPGDEQCLRICKLNSESVGNAQKP